MENWLIETSHGSHVWINVQWVVVSAESVNESLVWLGRLLEDLGRSSGWDLWEDFCWSSFEAESTETSDEERDGVYEEEVLGSILLLLVGRDLEGDEGSFSFIGNICNFSSGHELLVRDQWLEELHSLFSVEEHHWVEFWHSRARNQSFKEINFMNTRAVGREDSKIVLKLVGELVVFFFKWVLTVADTCGKGGEEVCQREKE